MPDQETPLPQVPESTTVPKKRTRLSLVWVIPIVAAAAGVWIAANRIFDQGPRITIVFSSADGLEANKTRINCNGLDLGVLTAMHFSDDHQRVVATAQMNPKTDKLLVKDTQFWVVKPRVSGLNISGLGTLISGQYIGMQIGRSPDPARGFVASENPPFASDVPGQFFRLKTRQLGSLGEGTPIYFRKLPVGQVVSYELNANGEFLDVKIFVQAPCDRFINPDTRFWHASGIDVSLSADGLRLQSESLMSILAGGIAFESPAGASPSPPVAANTEFTLFDDRAAAFRPPPCDPQTNLLVFKQSVRGLTVGAPVQVAGITVGEVIRIDPQWDARTAEFTVPVTICLDLQRYGVKFLNAPEETDRVAANKKIMDLLVARGLRAQLKTASLISGSLYVSLDIVPDAPVAMLDWSQSPVQLPTIPGKIEDIEDTVAILLKNLDQTITNADILVGSANQLLEPDSTLGTGLNNLLLQGSGAARSIRVLADYLERHPEALIRGKTGEAKP